MAYVEDRATEGCMSKIPRRGFDWRACAADNAAFKRRDEERARERADREKRERDAKERNRREIDRLMATDLGGNPIPPPAKRPELVPRRWSGRSV